MPAAAQETCGRTSHSLAHRARVTFSSQAATVISSPEEVAAFGIAATPEGVVARAGVATPQGATVVDAAAVPVRGEEPAEEEAQDEPEEPADS
jgi:hypothetical protein